MSEKDTVNKNIHNNIYCKEPNIKSNINLFEFSNLKSKANIIISSFNFFNYDFETKTIIVFNKNEKDPINIKENTILNTIKNINLDLPSTQKINEKYFFDKFIDEYDTSFANFCEIDKDIFIRGFQGKRFIPYMDKFGNIKISVKNLLDLLKSYSHSLKLKIRRRFIKKYKKKKIFKTFRNIKNNNNGNKNIFEINNKKSEGLKLISLKKNLKISVQKINNNDNINKRKENGENNNYNNNIILSNNILNNNIFPNTSSNIIKSSLFRNSENVFNFSVNDQNMLNINNTNNTQQKNISDLLNKKIIYTPYTPYNNIDNNNNNSNKKNNNFNFNLSNNIISPLILSQSPYIDFLSPNAFYLNSNNIVSPLINDKFNFSNLTNIRTNPILFGNLNNNFNNQSPAVINYININPTYLNINNSNNNRNENGLILSPNLININKK